MRTYLYRSVVVSAVSAAALAVAGVATALLPDAASDVAVEHTAGVTVPGPNAAAGDHASGPDATPVKEHVSDVEDVEDVEQGEHGAAVSDLATSTTLTGSDKGAAIASLASDGRSDARGESADHAADGQAKAAEASATGQERSAEHHPAH